MCSLFVRVTDRVFTKSSCKISINRCSRLPFFLNSSAGASRSAPDDWEPGFGPRDDILSLPSKKEFRALPSVMKEEFKLWTAELKERLKNDPIHVYPPGEIHKVFTFSSDEDLHSWSLTSDKEQGFGYSECTLTKSSNGHVLFSGTLCTAIRQDGKSVRSGFCAIRSPRVVKSFARKSTYDWTQYTHVVMKIRGDGRSYVVNLGADGHFDTSWYDMYSYFLFTRGGPYWQIAKIPFSKFIFGHKGHIQDQQPVLQQDEITCLGLTLCDDIDGPFQLEIEYIGLEINGRHVEEQAYESYHQNEQRFIPS